MAATTRTIIQCFEEVFKAAKTTYENLVKSEKYVECIKGHAAQEEHDFTVNGMFNAFENYCIIHDKEDTKANRSLFLDEFYMNLKELFDVTFAVDVTFQKMISEGAEDIVNEIMRGVSATDTFSLIRKYHREEEAEEDECELEMWKRIFQKMFLDMKGEAEILDEYDNLTEQMDEDVKRIAVRKVFAPLQSIFLDFETEEECEIETEDDCIICFNKFKKFACCRQCSARYCKKCYFGVMATTERCGQCRVDNILCGTWDVRDDMDAMQCLEWMDKMNNEVCPQIREKYYFWKQQWEDLRAEVDNICVAPEIF